MALLRDQTLAGPRVYPGEWRPQQRSTLPAISVSIQSEDPRADSFDREPREMYINADVQIALWRRVTADTDDIDVLVDDLCREIECLIEREPTLCLPCVEDSQYGGTQLVFDDEGQRQMGAALLTYTVTYLRDSETRDAADFDNLATISAEFNVDGEQAAADRSSILFPAAGEIEFYGTAAPDQVTQFFRGSVNAAPTVFSAPDGRDFFTRFAVAEYAYARSDAFAHASQLGVHVPPPGINRLLRQEDIHGSPAQWPRTGIVAPGTDTVPDLFGLSTLGDISVAAPPADYTQLVSGLVAGATYVFSVYLTADTSRGAELILRDGVSGPVVATSGALSIGPVLTRYAVSGVAPSSGDLEVVIRFADVATDYRFPTAAQLESGATPTEFIPQVPGGPDVQVVRAQTFVVFQLNGQTGVLTNTGAGPEVSDGFAIVESDGIAVAKLRQT